MPPLTHCFPFAPHPVYTILPAMDSALTAKPRGRFGSFDRRVYILSLGWLVADAGFAMVIPFISIYFNQEMGMSMSAIGLFFGFSAILRAAPQPFAGWLSDRIGRVPIMGWSLIVRAVTFAGVGYAIMSKAGFFTIAAVISFNYIAGSVLAPAVNAMVADLVVKERRIAAFSFLRIAGNLGWAIGPALGGFVAHTSYANLFFLAAGITLLAGIYLLVSLRDTTAVEREELHTFKLRDIFDLRRDTALYKYCLISFVLFLAVAQLVAALSVYSVNTVGISQTQLGVLYTINGLMVVFLQFPIMAALRRLPLTKQLAAGAFVYAVGYSLVGFASGFAFLIACMVIITLAEIMVSPASLTLVANLSSAGKYGRHMGLYGFFNMAGWSFGPTVGGALLDVFKTQPHLMWITISQLAVAACVLYLLFGRTLPAEANSSRRIDEESSAAHA